MSSHSHDFPNGWPSLPEGVLAEISAQLAPGETPLALLEYDLDERLSYVQGLIVLTDRRLLSRARPVATSPEVSTAQTPVWQSWPLTADLSLRAKECGGAGILDLARPDGRVAAWRYTPGRTSAVHRLVDRFRLAQSGHTAEDEATGPESVCPSCGVPIGVDQGFCSACAQASIGRPARSLLRLTRFAKAHVGMALLGMGLMVAATGAGLVSPYMTKPILNDILIPLQNDQSVSPSLITLYLLVLLVAAVLTWLFGWAKTYVLAWVSERMAADLRNQTYSHLLRLSLEFFGGRRTGDLMSRVSTDTDRISYFLSVNLLDFASDLLMIVMTAVLMLWMNFYLALATLAPVPVIAFLVHRIRTRLRSGFQLGSRAWAEMTSVLADTIPGIRVVKAFAQERREIDRFHRANDRVFHAANRVNRLWSFFGPTVVLLTDIGQLVVWSIGASLVFHRQIGEAGTVVAFVTLISRFYGRLDSMSRFVSAVQRAAASAQRVFGILDREATVPEPVNPVRPGRLRGQIEFRDVSFRYGNRAIVEGVNLAIQPGEMIGLVGPSGAGKSTLVNLACRFYDVGEGAIFVDGTDIRSYAIEEYRRHIGLVLQEPFLFYGTIAENIAYGCPAASRQEIIAAARAARAHDFILRLPDGYDSLVGERGQSLSGGERQRISIARAILIDPRILMLDEATSSVDTETEREIQLALENLIRGRTTIAIAHRLSTLRRADRLVVIERGRITEVGPHEQLLSTDGTYARLYRAQAEMPEGASP